MPRRGEIAPNNSRQILSRAAWAGRRRGTIVFLSEEKALRVDGQGGLRPFSRPRRRNARASNLIGAWRSLVAHLLWEQRVACSNHAAPTSRNPRLEALWRVGHASAHLRTGEVGHAIRQGADEKMAARIRAREAARDRSS